MCRTRREHAVSVRPNYRHFVVDKKLGTRAGVSADFTSGAGARTWRAANVNTRQLRAVDSILFENYKRTNRNPAYGFSLSANKAITRNVSLTWGYARIDPFYGGLNSDRFHIGKRVFAGSTLTLSSRVTASTFVTRAVGNDVAPPQRTLLNVIFSYNAIPDLQRTGWF